MTWRPVSSSSSDPQRVSSSLKYAQSFILHKQTKKGLTVSSSACSLRFGLPGKERARGGLSTEVRIKDTNNDASVKDKITITKSEEDCGVYTCLQDH